MLWISFRYGNIKIVYCIRIKISMNFLFYVHKLWHHDVKFQKRKWKEEKTILMLSQLSRILFKLIAHSSILSFFDRHKKYWIVDMHVLYVSCSNNKAVCVCVFLYLDKKIVIMICLIFVFLNPSVNEKMEKCKSIA